MQQASCDPVGFTLLRVQVKMSSKRKATTVSGPEALKWLQKLATSSQTLKASLEGLLGSNVRVHHIMWCAQSPTKPALKHFNNTRLCSLHVSSENMLEFWSRRILAFVQENELEQYGYVAPT
jgi:hypothetical protein